MTERRRSRVGPKGQVVVMKEFREEHGVKEGGLVEQISAEKGVLLVPVSVDNLLEELDIVAEEIGEVWPKDISSVEAIREDRGKRWLKK